MKTSYNSLRAFRYAILSIASFLVFILIGFFVNMEYIPVNYYEYLSIFMMFMVIAFSFMGFIYSMKSIKEPNDAVKIIAFILNSILMLLFIMTIIANVIDIKNALS